MKRCVRKTLNVLKIDLCLMSLWIPVYVVYIFYGIIVKMHAQMMKSIV